MMTGAIQEARCVLRRWMLDPRLQRWARPIAYALAGFCLSAASLEQGALPLAMGFVWAVSGLEALFGALGAMAGYWCFWGQAGLQGLVWTTVALLGALTFGDKAISRDVPLLIPSVGMLTVSAVGLGAQLLAADTTSVLLYLIRVALGGAAPWLFRTVREKPEPLLRWLSWGLCVLALAQLAPVRWLGLGFVAAGAAAAGSSFPFAAVTGLAMDLAAVTPLPISAITVLCWLMGLLPFLPRRVRLPLPALTAALVMGLLGKWDWVILPPLALGGILGACLRPRQPCPPPKGHTGVAQVRLEVAAGALEQLRELVVLTQPPAIDTEALVEQACQQACSGCSMGKHCSHRQLRPDPQVLTAPLVSAAQLPQGCRKPGRLLNQLQQAQLRLRTLQSQRNRQQEYRSALLQQYRFLSLYLHSLADGLSKRETARPLAYTADVQVWGNRPQGENGDRCLHFSGMGTDYYIILCDGMGTGMEAAREAAAAGSLLKQLLRCGFPPEHALQSLNSIYALTDRGGCVSVDLARICLDSGKTTIYKWGAPASWHITRRGTEKLACSSLPPGIHADRPEAHCRLTLRPEQLLVLVSDGIPPQSVLPLAGQQLAPGELAGRLLETAREREDATVVILRLLPEQ